MNGQQQPQPSYEDLSRMLNRTIGVRDMLAQRVGSLMAENAELLMLVQELQAEIQRLQPVEHEPDVGSSDGDIQGGVDAHTAG